MSDDGWSAYNAQLLEAVKGLGTDIRELRASIVAMSVAAAADRTRLDALEKAHHKLSDAERSGALEAIQTRTRVGVIGAGIGAVITGVIALLARYFGGHS